jgi:UPF0716 protein FxsA
MFGRLLLLFTLVPIVELYILIRVGMLLGAVWAVVLVLVTGALGAYLARQQGFRVWMRIQEEMNAGRFPAEDLLDGFLIFIAGAVLITPGLLTDILGFAILFPLTRQGIRNWIKNRFRGMMESGNITFRGFWG